MKSEFFRLLPQVLEQAFHKQVGLEEKFPHHLNQG